MGNVEKIDYKKEDKIGVPISCLITDLNYIICSYINNLSGLLYHLNLLLNKKYYRNININSQNDYKGIVLDKGLNLIFDIFQEK